MKRKALIIGAAYHDPTIPGVYEDVQIWRAFLQSPFGGCWDEPEISVLLDPDVAAVKAAVGGMNAEYAFVVFAGHGETLKLSKPWRETVLHLGNHGVVTDSDLNPGTARTSMVLDCCRGVDNLLESVHFSEVSKSASTLPEEHRIRHRVAFDSEVGRAEEGLVQIFAAREGEYADDAKSFTRQLIFVAMSNMEKHRGTLHQNVAVELVAEMMKKETPQQHPEYKGGRRLNHFPFAIHVI
ncbi:MAG: caspase family protein [Verrucomicrobiota bacterium]